MKKTNSMDKQARPADELQEIYSRINGLGLDGNAKDCLNQLEQKDAALYDALGGAVLAFVTRAVNGTLRQRTGEVCRAGCLDPEDVISELSLRLLSKTGRFAAQLREGRFSMAYLYLDLRQGLVDVWRNETPHWGHFIGVDENGEKIFSQGYRLNSLDELLANAYEPVLNQAASDATPEEAILRKGFRADAERVHQILRRTLTDRQLAALLIKAERRDLDPELASNWAAGLSVEFPNPQSLANAACAAGKKLNAVKAEIYRVFQ